MTIVIYLASTCSICFTVITPIAIIKTWQEILSYISIISRYCLKRHIRVPWEPKSQEQPQITLSSQTALEAAKTTISPSLHFPHFPFLSDATKDPSHWHPAVKSFLSNCWCISIPNVLLLEVQVCKQAWFIELELIYHTL